MGRRQFLAEEGVRIREGYRELLKAIDALRWGRFQHFLSRVFFSSSTLCNLLIISRKLKLGRVVISKKNDLLRACGVKKEVLLRRRSKI